MFTQIASQFLSRPSLPYCLLPPLFQIPTPLNRTFWFVIILCSPYCKINLNILSLLDLSWLLPMCLHKYKLLVVAIFHDLLKPIDSWLVLYDWMSTTLMNGYFMRLEKAYLVWLSRIAENDFILICFFIIQVRNIN